MMPNDMTNGDLISREATQNLWCANCIITKFGKACNRTCRDIERIKAVPAVDAAPVVHARWINVREQEYNFCIGMKCSECGRRVKNGGENYCPKCGAKMDGKEEEREDV